MPRMNILRKLLWKIALKKVYNVTCPTMNTLNYIKKNDSYWFLTPEQIIRTKILK